MELIRDSHMGDCGGPEVRAGLTDDRTQRDNRKEEKCAPAWRRLLLHGQMRGLLHRSTTRSGSFQRSENRWGGDHLHDPTEMI